MARCPGCGKMASYDDSAEPEVDDGELEVQDGGGETADQLTVSGNVRVVLTSACCGDELKDAELEYTIDLEHDCPVKAGDDGFITEPDERYDLGDVEGEMTSRQQTTSTNRKTGKVTQIKNPRYMKTFYGASLRVTATCNQCKEEMEGTTEVEEQASGFNELT
jgi:hypothetical protein